MSDLNTGPRSAWIPAAVLLLALGTLVYLSWGWAPSTASYTGCGLANNAAWISVDWTSLPVDERSARQLAVDASSKQLRYLFPYTTYAREEGFSPSHAHAAEFVTAFRRSNRETLLLAWVGIPLKKTGITGIEGWTDLSDKNQRAAIISFVAELVVETGFDGAHLNVETVWDGSPDYLSLLDEMRAALRHPYILSVATPSWRAEARPSWAGDHRWSSSYYQAVAGRVDQVATMTYDSLAAEPHSYRLWLGEQIRGISHSLAGLDTELLIGISISREATITHHPGAENLQNGLQGICETLPGLSGSDHAIDGVSIYAAWEANAWDWLTWEDWLAGLP